ncbi:MAG: AAA family ATPase [Thermodesulfovibrionales bacterium]|nr:AAA family ATPase [Nitrospinota bacterium]MCG2709402.1 AAA family ATPase [Thermodesulfovibrionales bacterium]
MIYNKFFGFREEPFGVTPNPKFLYMSKNYEEAIAHLNFGISENKGFVMLTGEVGSGKTTLIRYLLNNLGHDTHTSLIINPKVDPLELLKLINYDFGVTAADSAEKDNLEALNNFLLDAFSKNEKAVLIIDEAQELSLESLEFIRLLSNLETDTKKLLQVILVGQPELKRIVASEPLKQLDQRIAVRYHLEPLSRDDTTIYINHRLRIAGGGVIIFPTKGMKHIYKYSHGIPRLINLACDRTLLFSYSEGKTNIDAGMVRKALRDLRSPDSKGRIGSLRPAMVGVFIFLLIVILAYGNVSREDSYFEKISSMLKGVKIEGDFFISDGIYKVSNEELFEAACTLNLLNIWGEKDLKGSAEADKEIAKRGFSVYKFGSDIDKAVKFNMPSILYMKHGNTNKCVVLRWVVENDAMLIDPREGKNVLPVKTFKNMVTEGVVFYKDRYRGNNRILLLQQELKARGLYDYPATGELEPRTKQALMKFQEREGLVKTGELDEETAVMLSNTEGVPKLVPE